MSDDLTKDVRGWLQSQEIDHTAEYLRRGRQFDSLSLDDLTAQWAATFKDPDLYMRSREHRSLTADYMSEFSLRKVEPPIHVVKDDFAKIQKAVRNMMRGLSKEAYKEFAA